MTASGGRYSDPTMTGEEVRAASRPKNMLSEEKIPKIGIDKRRGLPYTETVDIHRMIHAAYEDKPARERSPMGREDAPMAANRAGKASSSSSKIKVPMVRRSCEG